MGEIGEGSMFKRFNLVLLTLFIVLVTNVNMTYASNELIPERVRVGISYDESAPSNVTLKSKHGFNIGYYDENKFIHLMDFSGYSSLIVRKDDYYNTSLKPLDTKNGASMGPYHVQIGDPYDSLGDALTVLASIRKEYPNCYVSIDKGYKVWTGAFVTESDARGFIDKFNKINNRKLKFVNSNGRRVIVNDVEGKILFAFNTDGLQLNFKSLAEIEGSNLVNINGVNYRGEVIFNRHDGGNLIVINNIDIDKYLYGVLPKEMSGDWPLEALKAQAIAARNYGIVNIGKHNELGFDICDTIDCQVYGGYDIEKPRCNEAVEKTKGIAITYEDKLITPFYHSNSGGRTEDSENIWSITLPYIRGKEDRYSLDAPHSNWSIAFTKSDVKNALSKQGIDIGNIKDMYPTEYSQNDRVTKMMYIGSKGKIEIPKEKTRAMFGYYTLKSMQFTMNIPDSFFVTSDMDDKPNKHSIRDMEIATKGSIKKLGNINDLHIYDGEKMFKPKKSTDKFLLTGKGWGHGLGMSQWGAKKMAEEGLNYKDILEFYYTGTKVE